ncbi:mammalian DNA polymerase-like protein [Perilla frutescens var. frutescens]|nr:mammalian DNA polymerase-like protein [Perilla frutescens var. frutescens]
MSATLPNVSAVAEWLQAALYQTEFRPVPLEEYIKIGSTIYNKEMEIVRTIPKVADLGGKDPDHIVELCNEVVQEGHSVLIFCSSRKGCESTAKHIAKYLKGFYVNPNGEQGESFDIAFAIDSLRRSPAGLDPILEETLPFGVAYHHAGLTVEERETVEMCYRKGLVRVLTATSTLAAGVNLPARRVIFRQPRIGRDFIDGTRYKQMAGRAGRTGIDTKGESVLICKPEETKKILALLNDSCPPLHSCLSEDRNGMTHAILEVVAGGIVQTASDIHRYVRCTLLNSTKPFEDVVKSAQDSLRWLCHRKFLEWNDATKLYTTSPLGRASFGSSLCPEESLIVLDDLMRAREGFVLASDLHLVYLVTPINVDVEPDWELYYERYMQISSLDQSVGNRVGVQEPFLMRMAHGAPSRVLQRSRDSGKSLQGKYDHKLGTLTHGMLSDEQMLRVCKRFYVALILSRLVQEVPVGEVCEGFKVARGMVQALQENAGRFASMVSVFCERLGWHDLESLVAKFQYRVSFGVRAEIVELTAIPFIKGSRARALYRAGMRTPQAIAEASIPEIVKALFESSSWSAQDMEGAAQRKLQVGVSKKIKNGARKIVLEKAEEARVAAFSAFKSLGLDVAQFSRPLKAPQKETSSSGEESTSSLQQSKKILDTLSVEDRRVEEDKPMDPLPAGPVEENSAGKLKEHAHFGEQQPENENIRMGSRENKPEKGPVNATSVPGGLDSFLDLLDATTEFFFDIHFTKKSELNSTAPFEIHGIAICWENSPVYYLSIPKDLSCYNSKGDDHSLAERMFFYTTNLQVLKHPAASVHKFSTPHGGIRSLGLDLIDNSYFMFSPVHMRNAVDLCVLAWILSPDEEKSSCPNLEKMERSDAESCTQWMLPQSRTTRALSFVLWKLLHSEELVEPLITVEVRLVNILADMEIWGIGVDMEGCLRARHVLGRKLKFLEKEAYRLAGKTFSLSMPADIANILYEHLKLPIPEGYEGKQHHSTGKHCLDMLRNEHPIVPVIKEHRTLAKLFIPLWDQFVHLPAF